MSKMYYLIQATQNEDSYEPYLGVKILMRSTNLAKLREEMSKLRKKAERIEEEQSWDFFWARNDTGDSENILSYWYTEDDGFTAGVIYQIVSSAGKLIK